MYFTEGIILPLDAHDVQILDCYNFNSSLILNKCDVNFGNSSSSSKNKNFCFSFYEFGKASRHYQQVEHYR